MIFPGDDMYFDEIKKTVLPVLTYGWCSEIPFEVTSNEFFCAGDEPAFTVCDSYSKGPFQVFRKDPLCMHYILGVVTFSSEGGLPEMPTRYTKVSYYLDWIEGIVW